MGKSDTQMSIFSGLLTKLNSKKSIKWSTYCLGMSKWQPESESLNTESPIIHEKSTLELVSVQYSLAFNHNYQLFVLFCGSTRSTLWLCIRTTIYVMRLSPHRLSKSLKSSVQPKKWQLLGFLRNFIKYDWTINMWLRRMSSVYDLRIVMASF